MANGLLRGAWRVSPFRWLGATDTATVAKKRAPVRKAALPTAIGSTAAAVAVNNEATAPEAKANDGLMSIARDLRSWADFGLGVANTAADLSFRVANSRLTKLSHKAAVKKAESVFRSLRESAGLTLKDIGKAINLEDLSLLEAVEGDKVGLPFEVILRLAGVLGRNDPIPVAMRLTRSYNPRLWETLEALGLGLGLGRLTLGGAGGARAGVRQHLPCQ